MKKKIGSLLLAFALPLSSCNFNSCSADSYQYYESGSFSYAQKRELEDEIKRLQESVEKLEKEKKLSQLQEQMQKLEKDNKNKKSSSFWASTKRIFKNFFSTSLGVIGSVCVIGGILAALATVFTGGVAAYDCYTDDKCHFNDKSFLKKFNVETFKKSFKSLSEFVSECMKNVHIVHVNSNNED